MRSQVPTLKGTEASLSYVKCFLYLVSFSIDVSIFHSTCWILPGQTYISIYVIWYCLRFQASTWGSWNVSLVDELLYIEILFILLYQACIL